jgi:hypothetical protein
MEAAPFDVARRSEVAGLVFSLVTARNSPTVSV